MKWKKENWSLYRSGSNKYNLVIIEELLKVWKGRMATVVILPWIAKYYNITTWGTFNENANDCECRGYLLTIIYKTWLIIFHSKLLIVDWKIFNNVLYYCTQTNSTQKMPKTFDYENSWYTSMVVIISCMHRMVPSTKWVQEH